MHPSHWFGSVLSALIGGKVMPSRSLAVLRVRSRADHPIHRSPDLVPPSPLPYPSQIGVGLGEVIPRHPNRAPSTRGFAWMGRDWRMFQRSGLDWRRVRGSPSRPFVVEGSLLFRSPAIPAISHPSPLAPTRIPKHLQATTQVIPFWRRLQRSHLVWRGFRGFGHWLSADC